MGSDKRQEERGRKGEKEGNEGEGERKEMNKRVRKRREK